MVDDKWPSSDSSVSVIITPLWHYRCVSPCTSNLNSGPHSFKESISLIGQCIQTCNNPFFALCIGLNMCVCVCVYTLMYVHCMYMIHSIAKDHLELLIFFILPPKYLLSAWITDVSTGLLLWSAGFMYVYMSMHLCVYVEAQAQFTLGFLLVTSWSLG